MRGSERPETLQEAGMDHTGTRALEDVKISTLDLGIALVDTRATWLPKDTQVPTGALDVARAVRIHGVNHLSTPEILERNDRIRQVLS